MFCGSSPGTRPVYAEAAAALGAELAGRGLTLVYGGGDRGLMGTVARAVADGGAPVIGITVGMVAAGEGASATPGRHEVVVAASLSERKQAMADRAQAFVMLPGGFGTLDELFEMVTWNQLGVHRKPCGVLDIDGFFGPLRSHVERAVIDGFVRPEHAAALVWSDDPAALLDELARRLSAAGAGW